MAAVGDPLGETGHRDWGSRSAASDPMTFPNSGRRGCDEDRTTEIGAKIIRSDPAHADLPKAWPAREMPRNRRPKYPDGVPKQDPTEFNAHNPGGKGSGLVQPAFRSPARSPAMDSGGEACAPRRQAKNALHYHTQGSRSGQETSTFRMAVADARDSDCGVAVLSSYRVIEAYALCKRPPIS
jgi:hypothetical protein